MMNASWWNIHPFVFTQSLFSFQGTTLWRVLPFRKVVGSSGLEPPTSRLSGARSNRLSYEPILDPGSHLLSRAVSSQVSSAACVLTVVFGMGTGVSHRRITTGNLTSAFSTFKTKHGFHQEAFLFYHIFFFRSSPRPISISKLNTLLYLHL